MSVKKGVLKLAISTEKREKKIEIKLKKKKRKERYDKEEEKKGDLPVRRIEGREGRDLRVPIFLLESIPQQGRQS